MAYVPFSSDPSKQSVSSLPTKSIGIHGPEQYVFPFSPQSPDWHWYSDLISHFGAVKQKSIRYPDLVMSSGNSFQGIPNTSKSWDYKLQDITVQIFWILLIMPSYVTSI